MHLLSIATALPQTRLTQAECWEVCKKLPVMRNLRPRSIELMERVLTNDNGIDTRHYAVDDFNQLSVREAEELNLCFEQAAPPLAAEALSKALNDAGLSPQDLDAVFICTCTGYLCPGLTGYVSELIGIRPNAFLHDVVGLGCGAAIPTLHAAASFLNLHPNAKAAVVAVEICSAAFFLDDDPGVIISACLFGDGAAATIWSGKPGGTGWCCFGFDTEILTADRDLLRFENSRGRLRNRLHRSVPVRSAKMVKTLFDRLDSPPGEVVSHAGGRDVLLAIQEQLPGFDLSTASRTLARCGNLSSPAVLFALEDSLSRVDAATQAAYEKKWLVSFGAGLSAHSCRFEKV